MKEVRCYRCGNVVKIDKKNVGEFISCGHCHAQMKIDKKSKFRFYATQFGCIAIFVFGLAFLETIAFGKNQNFMLTIIIVMAGTIMMVAMEKQFYWLAHRMFGLNYEEYHEKPVERKKKK